MIWQVLVGVCVDLMLREFIALLLFLGGLRKSEHLSIVWRTHVTFLIVILIVCKLWVPYILRLQQFRVSVQSRVVNLTARKSYVGVGLVAMGTGAWGVLDFTDGNLADVWEGRPWGPIGGIPVVIWKTKWKIKVCYVKYKIFRWYILLRFVFISIDKM